MPRSALRAVLIALALAPAAVQAEAGRFLLAIGEVSVVRGSQTIAAQAGTQVESGDLIRVGARSNAQLRFTDESITALRERTEFRIDEYRYAGRVDGSERSFFSLIAGGLRTVTGAIGRLRNDDKYAVRTRTSTIGIRGTHYVLRECNERSPCTSGTRAGEPVRVASASDSVADLGPLAQFGGGGQGAPFGTYGGVSDGSIGVRNDTPEQTFGANQFFFVSSRQSAPQSLIGPPPFLFDGLSGRQRRTGQQGGESSDTQSGGGVNSESRSTTPPLAGYPGGNSTNAVDPTPFGNTPSTLLRPESTGATTTPTTTTTSTGARDTGALAGWILPGSSDDLVAGGVLIPQSQLTLTPAPLAAFTVLAGDPGPNAGEAVSGTLGTPAETGSATFPGSSQTVFWGRWESGTINDTGQTVTLDPMTHAHLMYGPLTPADTVASKTGSLMLQSAFPGGYGTTPSNNFGALANAALFPMIDINFDAKTVNVSAWGVDFPSVGNGTQLWSFPPGSGALTLVQGAGAYFLVDVTGGFCSSSGTACNGSSVEVAKGRTAGILLGPVGDHAGVALGGAAGSSQFNAVRVFCVAGC